MGDENLYLEATKEVESGKRDPALWAKVLALAEGAQDKAKYQYIKLRVEQLAKIKGEEKPTFSKKTVSDFDLKYMPIENFSKIKSIPEKKVIEMIRDGSYVGQIRNNEWFVSRDEVGKEEQAAYTKPKPSTISKRPEMGYIPIGQFAEYKGLEPEKVIEMISEGSLQGQLVNGQWWVYYSEVKSKSSSNTSSSGNFFSKLASGDFGLAKTYWLYGILVSLVVQIIGEFITSTESLVLVMGIYIIYMLPVLLGIWRASKKYTGPYVWAVLAKIAVVLGWLSLGSSALVLITSPLLRM